MALTSDSNLQGLANPPSSVSSQASAMADVESVDGLHQTADGFLEEIGVAEGVMAKALGDVGSQADIGRSQTVFEMNVAVMQAANGRNFAGFAITMIADELSHGPRL